MIGGGLYQHDRLTDFFEEIKERCQFDYWIHELVQEDAQFIIATHSPILMAYPDAEIIVLSEDGAEATPYKETEHYTLTRRFLENPETMLRYLLEE